MGKYFSDVVDQAIEDLYYCYDNDKAKVAGNYGPAREALKNYKKSLFGVWRRK